MFFGPLYNVYRPIAHIVKLTSNALFTLVLTKQDCFKELIETVDITRPISEFIWQ